jgi:hypothetical protein
VNERTVLFEERYHDKSEWGAGPWMDEPDKMHWIDEATDMDCLIVRNGGGALCGYVGVTEGHPMFGKHYDEAEVTVHGGLTFSDYCAEDGKICHVPAPGRPERVYWFGFDCSHSGDYSPAYAQRLKQYGDIYGHTDQYRNVAYVQAQCAKLARQLKAVQP